MNDYNEKMDSAMDSERLHLLIGKLCDETIGSNELAELDATLAINEEARRLYRRYMNLHAALHAYLAAEPREVAAVEAASIDATASPAKNGSPHLVPLIPPARVTPIQAQPRPKVNPVLLAAAAAVVFGVGLVAVQWLYENVPGLPGGSGKQYAVLTQVMDAEWAPGSFVPEEGKALGNETLKLASGSVRINFGRGADVIFTEEAEIEILTDNSVRLESGKMLAEVPASASGFTVDAGSFDVIDIGTVFGVTIGEDGEVGVSVVSGNVELAVKDPETGEQVRILPLRKWQSVVAHPADLRVEKQRYDVTAYVGLRASETAPF